MTTSRADLAGSVSVPDRRLDGKHGFALFVAATAAVLALVGAIFWLLPPVRIGDGMEYYALFLAWVDTLRPWMTETSYHAYQALHDSGRIIGTHPDSFLRGLFPALTLGATSDFNHFWLYSSLAALIHGVLGLVGIHLGAHASFLALHVVMLVGLLAIAAWCNGRAGYVAVLLLAFASPIIWYFDKVHSEFYTFCLTTGAVALAMRNQLVAGSVLMAAAAAQNPGLSFVAVTMLALRGFGEWKRLYSRWEVVGIVLAVALLAAHPAYYFLRYGVVTPQMLAGGASLGRDLSSAYIWLIDPDVGLFLNWPLGLILCIVGMLVWRNTMAASLGRKNQLFLLLCCSVFLLAALYSHASTETVNSGGTPGLSRYALWYIAPVYPLAVACVVYAGSVRRPIQAALVVLAVALSLANGFHFLRQWESYHQPTPVSRLIQRHFPWLYNPRPEIFLGRFAGPDQHVKAVMAVVGPDCDKVLILPRARPDAIATVPFRCAFVGPQLEAWAREISRSLDHPIYLSLRGSQAVLSPPPVVEIGTPYSHDPDTLAIRLVGWSIVEEGHRWSARDVAGIRLLLPTTNDRLCLALDGATFGPQEIKVVADGKDVGSWQGAGPLTLDNIPLPAGKSQADVWLRFSNARSPGPQDPRTLAFALKSITVKKCP